MRHALSGLVTGIVFGLLVACGSDEVSATFRQIDRVGRPGIETFLLHTNATLNAFNAILPSADLDTGGEDAVAEMTGVLADFNAAGAANALSPPTVQNVLDGFLPDVMRIDTRLTISGNSNAPSYQNTVNDNVTAAKILVGGRKLTDDVVDMMLGYFFNGSLLDAAASAVYDDGVSYYGLGGVGCTLGTTNPAAPGHHCLEGQVSQYGTASFPFLATAN